MEQDIKNEINKTLTIKVLGSLMLVAGIISIYTLFTLIKPATYGIVEPINEIKLIFLGLLGGLSIVLLGLHLIFNAG